ncbi:MAG: efflux RND transporter periplasmic adaptor subunit [Rhodothermales bacterium]
MYRLSQLTYLLAFLLLATYQMGCSNAQSQPPEEEEEEVVPAVPVEAAFVTRGDISAFFSGTASLEAEEEATVATKTSGVVTKIFVEEGDRVKAGQALARLDGERLALELARTEVNLNKLKREHERNEGLFEKQLISVEVFEQGKSDYETQQAAYNLAKLELDYTTVRAPISGIVSQRYIKVGNTLQVNEQTFMVSDFDPLLAIMYAPEKELGKLKANQTARLTVDALSGTIFDGKIKRISPIVDATTGTFKVTIEVKDKSRQLKPGMFGRVQIVYDTHMATLLVPKEAVVEEDSEVSLYVVQDSLAFRKIINRGYVDNLHVEILDGIDEGAQIITAGQGSLRDSARVEVIK